MANRGIVLDCQVQRGFGTILWERPNEAREITFSFRELQNGGVEDLRSSPRRQVVFDVALERAVRVRMIGVHTHFGIIADFGDDANSWVITEDRTGLKVNMKYQHIFKALPGMIVPDERVSYTRDPQGREALNIRFPHLAPMSLSGVITSLFRNGEKGLVTPDGWGDAVIFHKRAFMNEPPIRIGMRVKFGLERACPQKLRLGDMNAIQATRMMADVPGIQEVEHSDLPPHSLQPAASSVSLQSAPIIGDEGVSLDGGEAAHSVMSELPLQLIQCTFSRNPDQFHTAMQDLMREKNGVRLLSGAYLFAHPLNNAVQDSLEAVATSSHDVILTPGLEDIVMTVVRSLRSSLHVKLKRRLQHRAPDSWEDLVEEQESYEGESADQFDFITVKFTFIQVPVPSSLLSMPSGGPRTESDVTSPARFATDVAANPRRNVRRIPAS